MLGKCCRAWEVGATHLGVIQRRVRTAHAAFEQRVDSWDSHRVPTPAGAAAEPKSATQRCRCSTAYAGDGRSAGLESRGVARARCLAIGFEDSNSQVPDVGLRLGTSTDGAHPDDYPRIAVCTDTDTDADNSHGFYG